MKLLGFLKKKLCQKQRVLLIFDKEVMNWIFAREAK